MSTQPKIFVAGHRGLVGSAIVRALVARGQQPDRIVTRGREELDLCNPAAVDAFFRAERVDQVYLAAAKVGGIHANNTYPADFIYQNLMIQASVIQAAHANDVQKLLFLGSSCIYPKLVSQPMSEKALLDGKLEPTNEPYAIAKIAGIKMCESYNRQHQRDYRSVMPTNLYGPGDNYHPENSHVIPALLRRFHESKQRDLPSVAIWGTGTPRREFLYVDDMASACLHVMNLDTQSYQVATEPMASLINVGYGSDVTIAELARAVSQVVGYKGDISFDTSKPDGSPRKLLDSSLLLSMGWRAQVDLAKGLELAYADFCSKNA